MSLVILRYSFIYLLVGFLLSTQWAKVLTYQNDNHVLFSNKTVLLHLILRFYLLYCGIKISHIVNF